MNLFNTHGAFSWSELMTADPDAVVKFYGTVLGWSDKVMPMPQGDYHVQMAGERRAGGIMALPDPGLPTAWLQYITVDDVDETAKRAVELGGQIVVPAMDIPMVGRFCGLLDPQNVFFHIIKYEQTEGGDEPVVEFAPSFATHGCFSWYQLVTTDVGGATEFYSRLLGWEIEQQQMPSGPYNLIKVSDEGMGGLMKVWSDDTPPHWGAYVTVDDADAVAASATGAGGKVIVPPTDIEGVGRFATLQDPTGGILNVIKYLPMEQ